MSWLSLFCAYHNAASWAKIGATLGADVHPPHVLAPLSLTPRASDPNGRAVQSELPELNDPVAQLQIGFRVGEEAEAIRANRAAEGKEAKH